MEKDWVKLTFYILLNTSLSQSSIQQLQPGQSAGHHVAMLDH